MRLTHKKEDWCWKDEEFWLSVENPSLEKADEIYYKLAEFEDFMEEQGFESLEELKNTVSNIEKLMLISAKTTNLEQENQALKTRLEKLLARYKNAEEQLANGELSDGYHTFNELYEFRKLYNALLFNEWAKNEEIEVYKSKRHYDNEECFGGGWFIVVAMLPSGQISNHYELKDWALFNIPEYEKSKYEFDGHTPKDVRVRMLTLLRNESCRIPECEKVKKITALKARWGKLKEYITQGIENDYNGCAYIYPDGLKKMQEILEKMQELEE